MSQLALERRSWRVFAVATLPNGASREALDESQNDNSGSTSVHVTSPGNCVILGDSWDNSVDSRALSAVGCLPADLIMSKVVRS
jgi:hypothetical protein